MPRTGTSSPSMRRAEHSDRENSDEEDAVTPNERHEFAKTETGMSDYGERKNASNLSLDDGRSSSSDGDSSFVGKIRSNFSGMLSVLLPARQSKQSAASTPERRSRAKNILDERNEEAQPSIELRKRPHSPHEFTTEIGKPEHRSFEMIRKRPRLRETADTREEHCTGSTSDTLRSQTGSSNNNHRLSRLMGSAGYRSRMQQPRHSVFGHKTLFGSSHLQSTRNRNDSVASSRRPSFNVSVAKMSKTLSNGWIPPEYGGSPFYEGLTRFGGASSARTLAKQGPSRPAVTVLVKKPLPTVKAHSLPDTLEETKPDKYASLSYPSRRILEIVQEYPIRSGSSTREMSFSATDVRTPRTLQMLNIIRSQQMERPAEEMEQPPCPPTVPLMEYSLPLHVDSTTSPMGRDEPKSTGGKQITKKTRLHADPIKERDVSTVEPIQLPNLQLPLEGLPKFDFTVPIKGPSRPADKAQPWKNTKPMHQDALPSNGEKKQREEIERNTPQPTTFPGVRSYGFTSPMPLSSSSEVTDSVAAAPETSNHMIREVTTFVFTSPKLLNGSAQPTNSVPKTVSNVAPSMHREKLTFVFVSPLALANSTALTELVSAAISFEFAAPEPLEIPNAPAVRSFQDLMAESAAKWACDVCMIRNEPNQKKCVACESPKPETVQKVRSFQDLMAESAAKWACDVCMIRNEPNQQKCVACESPKPITVPAKKKEQFVPAATTITNTSSGSFAAIVNAQSSRWECPACSVRNDPTASVCLCCATEKPTGTTK